ncbi:hypothetical protein LOD99_1789 [Oopsacas minuta]|uniref:Uncharacterized protein n=1 Tax=Oopsacas minuta TaxID=111878 RepID=A0AAV7K4M1_9METZ|nr:hypothetical protein LOD99_1789 [Oopsacas minuta]
MLINDYNHLQLSHTSQQVVVHISGYISLKLSEHTHCPVCLGSLNNNLISSEYVSNLNENGLTLTCTSLHHNVLSALCLLDVSEKEFGSSRYLWNSLAQILLSIATVKWNSSFAYVGHSENSKEFVNNAFSTSTLIT